MAAPSNTSPSGTGKKAQNVKRKRNKGESGGDKGEKENTKKPKTVDKFRDIEFKVMFKDPNTTFAALEKFIVQAQKYPIESEYDIIGYYCSSSGECNEVLQLLESGKRKPTEAHLIFEMLEMVLLRIADDLSKFKAIGQNIVRKILSGHMGLIYATLAMKNKSGHIKGVLKLLTAMILLGETSAKEFQAQFDFQQRNIKPLLNRRDRKDPQDVRTCLLQFIMAFLISGNNLVIKYIVEAKGFLNSIFEGFAGDKLSTLEFVLPTLLEKVVQNPTINKTTKIRLFNDKTLTELGALYDWKGPAKWKSADGKEDDQVENMPEDLSSIRDCVHKIMIHMCTDKKYGIIFHDRSLSTGGKNLNHILTNFLCKLKKPQSDDLKKKLIIESLKACPDQLHWYLPHLKESVTPRASHNWRTSMEFLCEIYNTQEYSNYIGDIENASPAKMTSLVTACLIPPKEILTQVVTALRHKNVTIRHHGLEFLLTILRQLNGLLAYVGENKSKHPHYLEFANLLREAAKKILPNLATIFQCWQNATTKVAADSGDKPEDMEVDNDLEFQSVEADTHLVAVLGVLCNYQSAFPTQYFEKGLDFSILFAGVKAACDGLTSDQLPLIQTYVLKLLSGTDVRQINWTKKTTDGHTTMYLLIEMVVSNSKESELAKPSILLVQKLFESTNIFEKTGDEIEIWLRQLVDSSNESIKKKIAFFEKAMLNLLNDPYSQTEIIAEAVSEASSAKASGDLETASLAAGDALADAIFSMDEVDFEESQRQDKDKCEQVEVSVYDSKFPFSPLVPAALESAHDVTDTDILVFIQSVLCEILLTQANPIPICILLQNKSKSVNLKPLMGLVSLWMGKGVKSTKTLPLNESRMSELHETYVSSDDMASIVDGMELVLEEERIRIARQFLLYLWTEVEHKSAKTKKGVTIVNDICSGLSAHLTTVTAAETDDQTPGKDKFDMLQIKERTSKEWKALFYKLILQHPVMKTTFLRHIGSSSKDGGFESKTTECVAKLVGFIEESDLEVLKPSLQDYIFKLTQMLRDLHTLHQFDAKCELLHDTFKVFVKVYDDSELMLATEYLLRTPLDVLTNDNDERSLSRAGDILLCAMKEVCARKSIQPFAKRQLSHEGIRMLFKVSSDKQQQIEVLGILKHILTESPAYSVCISEETFVSFLDNFQKEQLYCDILSILLISSVACSKWTENWLRGAKVWKKKNGQLNSTTITIITSYLFSSKGAPNDVWATVKEKFLPHINSAIRMKKEASKFGAQLAQMANILYKHGMTKEEQDDLWAVFMRSDSKTTSEWIQLFNDVLPETLKTEKTQPKTHAFSRKCLELLHGYLALKNPENEAVEKLLIQKTAKYIEANSESKFTECDMFVKNGLKKYYSNPDYMKLVRLIVETSTDEASLNRSSLYMMLVSHSMFVPVMLEHKDEYRDIKEPLVDAMLAIVERDGSCCQTPHIAVLLGAYTATLSFIDQKLLKLMWMYETSGCTMSDYRPFIFGPKAVEYRAIHKNLGPSLLKQATTDQVMELFDTEKLLASALRFPLRRQLALDDSVYDGKFLKTDLTSYDPTFVLPLFGQLLRSENVVNCRRFAETNCLGYAIAAMSSHDADIRGLASHVISLYVGHAEGSRFGEKEQVLYLLELVRNSMEKPGTKLACIITVFLVKALQILLKPDDDMYSVINSFLMLKPNMDILSVPEFFKLFNSSALEFKHERAWILSLLNEGLRETLDYHICQKRYVFKMLLSFYSSAISDNFTKNQTLIVLEKACSIKTVAFDLAKNAGILSWLSSTIAKDCGDARKVNHVTKIMGNLWDSMLSGRDDDSEQEAKRPCLPPQFTTEFFLTLRALLHKSQMMSCEVMKSFCACLSSVLKHIHKTNAMMSSGEFRPIASTLQSIDIDRLLTNYCKLTQNDDIHQESHALLLKSAGVVSDKDSKTFEDELPETTVSMDSTAFDIMEICTYWKLSLSCEHELDDHYTRTWFLTTKWIFQSLVVKNADDCKTLGKILSWIKLVIIDNPKLRRTLLSDRSDAKRCASDLLRIYDVLNQLTMSHLNESGDVLISLNQIKSLKKTLNDIFMQVLDDAMKPELNIESKTLSESLSSPCLREAIVATEALRTENNESLLLDAFTLMVTEVWFGSDKMSHFRSSVSV